MKYLLRIVALIGLYVIGLLLFTKGFLLKRDVLSLNSSCSADFVANNVTAGGCWLEPRFRRAVIIVIDALRFDFVEYADNVTDAQVLPAYRNKLTSLMRASRDLPYNARTYRFIADPPTTTLQRLKGLTTGSLPTFVDAGSNFASTEIIEDNIIDQFIKLNRNITFMGDDTWQSLFPRRFARSFPFPSFNVKDLETVDTGVISHLVDELRAPDWQLLIAHFLGVDHCGHTYGPFHPAMKQKLTQMDAVLQSVMSELDNDTLLFVFGDHGMTLTGDHGGDSVDELDAALFVYSPSRITHQPPAQISPVVYQVDLVPTLSLLLGVPIPFSNLGTIISDLFDSDPLHSPATNIDPVVKALRVNAHQVRRYILEYSKTSSDLPASHVETLDKKFLEAETKWQELLTGSPTVNMSYLVKELAQVYQEYLSEVRLICRSVWSKFDLVSMATGGIIVVAAFTVNIAIATEISVSKYPAVVIAILSLVVGLLGVACLVGVSVSGLLFSTSVCGALLSIVNLSLMFRHVCCGSWKDAWRDRWSRWNGCDVMSVSVCVLQSVSLLSNSFIVYEDRVVHFLLQSIIFLVVSRQVFHLLTSIDNSSRSRRPRLSLPWRSLVPILVLCFVISMCLRCSGFFRVCREEQVSCDPMSVFSQRLSAIVINDDSRVFRILRFIVSVSAPILLIILLTAWLRYHGNLNGYSPVVILSSYALPLLTLFLCFYWVFDGLLPASEIIRASSGNIVTTLPRLVYTLTLTIITMATVTPLSIYMLPSGRSRVTDGGLLTRLPDIHQCPTPELVPQIYQHIKTNWRSVLTAPTTPESQRNAPPSSPPVVYGLATVFSSTHLILWVVVAMVTMLLLGDHIAPSVGLLAAILFGLLELHAAYFHSIHVMSRRIPWFSVILVWFTATQHFFATGHQATIAGIRWDAAFHGFQGDHATVWLPALLVSLNTFSPYLLCTFTLPLLLYWPFTRGRHADRSKTQEQAAKVAEVENKGEFLLTEDGGQELKQDLMFTFIKFLLIAAFKLLCTMLCVTIHRRHLMVWKIFAPRFVYESCFFITVSLVTIVTYLFISRLNHCLTNWVTALCATKADT